MPALVGTTLTGTPAQIRERANALASGGCTEVVWQVLGDDWEREIRAMSEAFELAGKPAENR